MAIEQASLPERVASSFSLLRSAAKDLNSISGELSKSIAEIDSALKRLNLGVTVWVPIRKGDELPDRPSYWSEDIGYAKVRSNWGICLRTVDGDYQNPDQEETERWLFNDAPRILRISAIEKIPELLEKLSSEAVKTTQAISAKLAEAQAVASAVKDAASQTSTFPTIAPRPSTSRAVVLPIPSIDTMRTAICSALVAAGHSSASVLLTAAKWTLNGGVLRIAVAGAGKKVLALTVNQATEKIIRNELQKLGGPDRFLVTPDETITPSTSSETGSAPSTKETEW
jgi:hypothetical protein